MPTSWRWRSLAVSKLLGVLKKVLATALVVSLVSVPVASAYPEITEVPMFERVTVAAEAPAESFRLADGYSAPPGWVISVDVATGEVWAWAIAETALESPAEVPVTATLADGTEETRMTSFTALPMPPWSSSQQCVETSIAVALIPVILVAAVGAAQPVFGDAERVLAQATELLPPEARRVLALYDGPLLPPLLALAGVAVTAGALYGLNETCQFPLDDVAGSAQEGSQS